MAAGMGLQLMEAEITRFKKYTEGMKRYILCYQASEHLRRRIIVPSTDRHLCP